MCRLSRRKAVIMNPQQKTNVDYDNDDMKKICEMIEKKLWGVQELWGAPKQREPHTRNEECNKKNKKTFIFPDRNNMSAAHFCNNYRDAHKKTNQ